MNIAVLWPFAQVFPVKFGGVAKTSNLQKS